MNSLNKVQLIGNISSDIETKLTPNGQIVASFSIATNREWKDNNGEKQSQADFHNIVAWGKLAEIVEQYTSKGKKIYIEGELQTQSWEKDGEKKYKTIVNAKNIILLGNKETEDKIETKKAQKEEISISDVPF